MGDLKVITKVGQVWAVPSCSSVTLKSIEDGYVTVNGNCVITMMDLYKYYTFVPANDLEWLAVNVDEWFHSDCNIVRKNGATEIYSNSDPAVDDRYSYYTCTQWQNKRNELFGLQLVKMNVGDTSKWVDLKLPPIGSEVMGSMPSWDGWEQVRIIAHEANSCAVIKGESTLAWCDTFKLLDNRTDKEKLIDEINKALDRYKMLEYCNESISIELVRELRLTRKVES